ncbi:MAG: response regulator transcription factor [Pseudomonadota bacterium]
MSQSILIVEDDSEIRAVLRIAVGRAGFTVEEAGDGAEGLAKARSGRFALIVLDIGLPEMDGLALCQALRATHATPILFLTAQGDEVDRILGLEMGGDDYVTKPFSARELVARIRAILRRGQAASGLRRGVLEVDAARHHCAVDGTPLSLTAREMALLDLLMSRADQIAPRPALTDAMYGLVGQVSDRTLDSHLRNLRAKLAEAGCPDAIETVHGVGIRMGPCRGV